MFRTVCRLFLFFWGGGGAFHKWVGLNIELEATIYFTYGKVSMVKLVAKVSGMTN